MAGSPDIHATAITIEGDRAVAREALRHALPILALVDAAGIEHDPLDILSARDAAPLPTTAYRVVDIASLRKLDVSAVVEHHGPGTALRAQGYADIVSEFWDSERPLRVTVRYGSETLTFGGDNAEDVRARALVRWAREGHLERPSQHRFRALALLAAPPPSIKSRARPKADAEGLLRRGIVAPAALSVSAALAADHLIVMQYFPELAAGLNGMYVLADDADDYVGTLDAPPVPRTMGADTIPTRYDAAPLSSFTSAHDIGGGVARHRPISASTPRASRSGTTGRLVYLDASALVAGLDAAWFHPDDQVFTCEISAFDAAGVTSHFELDDGERKTWSVVSSFELKPIPVTSGLIYDYGARVLYMREKKVAVHPDATRYHVLATVVARHYNAVLATCFPERYKGLMPGLEIAHYEPRGSDYA